MNLNCEKRVTLVSSIVVERRRCARVRVFSCKPGITENATRIAKQKYYTVYIIKRIFFNVDCLYVIKHKDKKKFKLKYGQTTVTALIRFELRFVVASSRCRVGAFTCALVSERVIARCMLLVITSHCLLFYCTTSAFVNRNSFFLFLDTKQPTLLFLFYISIDVEKINIQV